MKVGFPANELPNDQRPAKPRHPLAQITLERPLIKPMILANRADVPVERHYFALPVCVGSAVGVISGSCTQL
jgi:hypothetical protein